MRIRRLPEFVAQDLQEGHGGWSPGMARELGNTGTVTSVDGDGDCHVSYDDGGSHCWNPVLLKDERVSGNVCVRACVCVSAVDITSLRTRGRVGSPRI